MRKYTKEDLDIDVEWLIGQGVNDNEAEEFIIKMNKWQKELKKEKSLKHDFHS